ncbi:MAG: sorbosone dehydrogenase family protein [Verrucomicrobiota bacterium]
MKSARLSLLSAALVGFSLPAAASAAEKPLLTGKDAMSDWTGDAPGVRRKITVADLPKPGATESSRNMPKKVKRPESAWPKAPEGFKVDLYAEGFKNPRKLLTAPNGDIFVSESTENEIRVLRDSDNDGKPDLNESFATGLNKPFGLAFYPAQDPKFLYVANTDSVVRFPYQTGDTKVSGKAEKLFELSRGGQLTGGGHWTRDIVFNAEGTKLYVSVGSKSNNDDAEVEKDRARIFESDPDGRNLGVFATGIRNPVGLAIHPVTGELWTSVNERDELGDDLVPDYVTRVKKDGFYGWPWFYIGGNQDPHHAGKHPELKDKVIVPDVLLQSHSASLNMLFYTGRTFPETYTNNAFSCLHGSWNRSHRTGYKVVSIPTENGKATGEYVDFLTGFVTPEGDVWGRPVGITVAKDGALLVSDDGGNCIWSIRAEKR